MNGQTALWYARSRKTTSDFSATAASRKCSRPSSSGFYLETIIKRRSCMRERGRRYDQHPPARYPALPAACRPHRYLWIKHYYVNKTDVTNWITPEGAMVLLPNREAILRRCAKP
jgi:hypothetical protein